MDFGINKGTREDAKKDFIKVFGHDFLWFWDILEYVKKIEIEKELKITDILIKKDSPVMVGILKNFFVMTDFIDAPEIKIPGTMIRGFTEKYYSSFYSEKKWISQSDIKGSKDFALNIYTLGSYRVNYSESATGPMLNVRVLDFNIPTMEELLFEEGKGIDLDDIYFEFFQKYLLSDRTFDLAGGNILNLKVVKEGGLIIHAGPTGSGKTTAIASELEFIARNVSGLIITYERPIEYRFIGYPNVIQFDLDKHLSEDQIYYHFLRNSPMVGFFYEIRNRDEFKQVVDLASRGHLVFTTMHAGSVYEVFSSFAFFEEEVRQLFAAVLKAIVCHRLETDSKGCIVPVYEAFLAKKESEVALNLFMRGEMTKLKNFLYKEYMEKLYSGEKNIYFWTFDEYRRRKYRKLSVINKR